ncbi:MAG: hypothetical protein FJ215_11090 [Ignavibacteria bacterium]|nr:hypothetical protein [Ignavibacteria bacterium]
MPNVNLIEDEGAEESMESVSTPMPRRGTRGGGMGRVIIILMAFVVIVGGVFLLNRYGIINLWGKKPAPIVTQVEQPPFADQPYPAEGAQPSGTQSGVELVETPPIEGGKKPAGTVPAGSASKQLAEMKGSYTIQVFAHRDKATADGQVAKLEQAGYPAFVELKEFKSEPWYTVRIGKYQSAKDAAQAVQSFAYELRSNYWIDKVRSQ